MTAAGRCDIAETPAFDIRDLSARDAIAMVTTLRTRDARWLWMNAMQWTRGEEAVPFARALLQPGAEKQGHVLIAALNLVSQRAPQAAVEDATRLLGERRSFEVHLTALHVLTDSRRPEDIDPIYDYFARRVARPRWLMGGGDWEIPGYIRFAAETDTLPRIATLLQRRWVNLDDHEQARVEAAWPTADRDDTAAGHVHPPHLTPLLAWEHETAPQANDTAEEQQRAATADFAFMNARLAASWSRHKPRNPSEEHATVDDNANP